MMKRTGIVTIEFFKGQSGQTSIELILVVGAIFLIVISTLPYIGDANKMNNGIAAARDGATFAQTMLNMGYATGNTSLPQGETVHVDDITYSEDTTTLPDTKIVRITLTISGTSDTDVADEIVSQVGNHIHYAFKGAWNTGTNGNVTAGNHRFEVDYEFA